MRVPVSILALLCAIGMACSISGSSDLRVEMAQKSTPVSIRSQNIYLCVHTDVLSVRSGPDVSFGALAWLLKFQRIQKIRNFGDWFFVSASSATGWVNSRYLGDCG